MKAHAERPNKNLGLVQELLRATLPAGSVISDAEGMRPYECDGLTAIRAQPWMVVLPETEEQVANVVRICHEHEVPIVPRGAGTGLSGGARPNEDAVVLGLSKLTRIIDIDADNSIAWVQPGVRNLAISEAAAVHGLY